MQFSNDSADAQKGFEVRDVPGVPKLYVLLLAADLDRDLRLLDLVLGPLVEDGGGVPGWDDAPVPEPSPRSTPRPPAGWTRPKRRAWGATR
jgi:hypothetical protein